MERSITKFIKKDRTHNKIILLSGPRQSGKTTLSKSIFKNFEYFSFDLSEDRDAILAKKWRRDCEAVIFDELHKMLNWKSWLKGIYDTEGNRPSLFVTGSANLETFSKVGDSLAGRYFQYRLHPIDVEEGITYWKDDPTEVMRRLTTCGGFPEPFLLGESTFYKRWQKSHLDIILRQDFLDLFSVRSIKRIELLLDCLKQRVGSTVSYHNLASDLQVDPKSIQSWLIMLENVYAVFRLTPYHHNIARSLLKEPKVYFYDTGRIVDKGAQLENLVACALLKRLHFLEDVFGKQTALHYLRTKDGHEIDFAVVINNTLCLCLEVKTSDDKLSKSFSYFKKYIGDAPCVQIVLNLKREYDTKDGIQVRNLASYLASLSAVLT